jgi:hypothetical protein
MGDPVSGGINTETWSSRLGVGREADNLAHLAKGICWESSGEKILEDAKNHLYACCATEDNYDDPAVYLPVITELDTWVSM